MIFQVTKDNKRGSLKEKKISFIVFILILITFTFILPSWIIIIVTVCFFGFFDFGPALYLFNEYLQFNNEFTFEIHVDEDEIKYYDNKIFIGAKYNEIKQVDVYVHPYRYRYAEVQHSFIGEFLYSRVTLKDGREFYLTNLMIPDLLNFVRNFFPDRIILYRWWIFPSIRLCNYFRKKKGLKEEEFV